MPIDSNPKLRVVIAGQTPPPIGGQNICIQRILDLLSQTDCIKVDHLAFEFTKSWNSARKVGGGKLAELMRVLYRLSRLRSNGGIDVLIYPAGGPHAVAILRDMVLLPFMRLCSRRVVIHFHAAGLHEYLESANSLIKKCVPLAYSLFSREAVVNSNFGKKDAGAAGIKKIHVIPNAVEDLAGGFLEQDMEPQVEILSVGHLCRDKGTPQLLTAFGRLSKMYPDIRLKVVGEPLPPYSEKKLLQDIAATGCSERIEWAGVLTGENLSSAFRKADLFVFSSVAPYESFGLVMVEAMQWSLPLVVTDWRANLEVCTEKFGGSVARNPENDLETSLATALEKTLDERQSWPEWAKKNRKIYERLYSVHTWKSKLLELIDPSLGKNQETQPS